MLRLRRRAEADRHRLVAVVAVGEAVEQGRRKHLLVPFRDSRTDSLT